MPDIIAGTCLLCQDARRCVSFVVTHLGLDLLVGKSRLQRNPFQCGIAASWIVPIQLGGPAFKPNFFTHPLSRESARRRTWSHRGLPLEKNALTQTSDRRCREATETLSAPTELQTIGMAPRERRAGGE